MQKFFVIILTLVLKTIRQKNSFKKREKRIMNKNETNIQIRKKNKEILQGRLKLERN